MRPTLGTAQDTKSDEFPEKYETAFAPPPLRKIILQFFFMLDTEPSKIAGTISGCVYASRYGPDSMKDMHRNPEMTLLYLFHAQKALFKVPKICDTNFWIENDPPLPLEHFQKFIGFSSLTRSS